MAWLSSINVQQNQITRSISRYYETRQKPDNDKITQIREIEEYVREYPGLTLEAASGFGGIEATETESTSIQITAIGGGGYTLTTTTRTIIGDWTDQKE